MNFEEIVDKIDNKDYETKLHWPTHKTSDPFYAEEKKLYQEDAAKLIAEFLKDCREAFQSDIGATLTDVQWGKISGYAWSEGHSSGLRDVLYHLIELTDVIAFFVVGKTRG